MGTPLVALTRPPHNGLPHGKHPEEATQPMEQPTPSLETPPLRNRL